MSRAGGVLITGGAGFIGSHLAERLFSRGKSVTVLDNLDPFYDPEIKRDHLASLKQSDPDCVAEGDVRDAGLLARLFGERQFDTVFHLAAKTGVRPSLSDPVGYFDVNVGGTIALLEACRRAGVKRFIFASSSSVYGDNHKVPFSESDRADDPVSPYAASKRSAEVVCRTYHELYGIPMLAIRFFTVYGPRQRPDMAIYRFVERVLSGRPVEIFGDGSMARDFTYIDDIVDGLEAALGWERSFETVNLGEARTVSVSDLVSMIEAIAGAKADRRTLPVSPGDVRVTCADIGKAARLLGYKPRVPLEEGLRHFIDWYRRHGPRQSPGSD